MVKKFINDLYLLYKNIEKQMDKKLIIEFKEKWNIKNDIGDFYETISLKENRKKKGRFYTPLDIVDYINKGIINNINLENFKILDPSCGGGYFLKDAYLKLRNCLDKKEYNNENIVNMLYGYDIDSIACLITKIEIFYVSGVLPNNIYNNDFLLDESNIKYDFIIGNPPYIGHKVLEGTYRKLIQEKYSEVFYDKADLSYCFIKKSIDSLKSSGEMVFFTSRYILESLYGKGIREYIIKNANIKDIIDFYGVRVVKGAGVDNIIIKINKHDTNINYFKLNLNAKDKGKLVFSDIDSKSQIYSKYMVYKKSDLTSSGWNFLSKVEKDIVYKIESLSEFNLSDICESFQGIITGCDKAFILENDIDLEENILKPWIKGKQVNKFKVDYSNKKIIYSDIIKNEKDYPLTIAYLSNYKSKLSLRRECVKGLRNWYNIQWGRKPLYFEGKKIIFPYKSSSNRFSIDKGNYFSADIYALKIKEDINYSYEFLECILNSSIYEFYIKTIAKKLGENLYEYYPNKIMEIKVPKVLQDILNIYKGRDTQIEDIDNILKEYFKLTDLEYKVVTSWCSR